MKMEKVKVIGVDPAGSDNSHCYWYDGEMMKRIIPSEFPQELAIIRQAARDSDSRLCVCWDSPLTMGWSFKNGAYAPNFSKRYVEKLFDRQSQISLKLPSGIFTKHYSGVTHWAISQYCLGYPVTQPFCNIERDFTLLTRDNLKSAEWQEAVVETHPAVAAWWWTRDTWNEEVKCPENSYWKYKTSKDKRVDNQLTPESFYKLIGNKLTEKYPEIFKNEYPEIFKNCLYSLRSPDHNFSKEVSDGELDAFVSWLLGTLWLRADSSPINLIGNEITGGWLMPEDVEEEIYTKLYE